MGISGKPFCRSEKSKKITKLSRSTANHSRFLMAARPAGRAVVDAGDWRTHLIPGSRERIVNKIYETLQRRLPLTGDEVRQIAARFEVKIYNAATSVSEYLRKISLKMLSLEPRSQQAVVNSLQSNGAGSSGGLPGPA